LPGEAQRLVSASAPHLRPLLIFLFGTGARLGEALALDWRDVDLQGARALFQPYNIKSGRRRIARLPPTAIAALGSLQHREGRVFRWHTKPTADGKVKRTIAYTKPKSGGGQIKTAWGAAVRRAGLDPALTPHDARHSWATWHYALHRDLLALKVEGAWSTIALVERYAHLMPHGHEDAICDFWGYPRAGQGREVSA
jgi:integrase